jgi:hypothetical protein
MLLTEHDTLDESVIVTSDGKVTFTIDVDGVVTLIANTIVYDATFEIYLGVKDKLRL